MKIDRAIYLIINILSFYVLPLCITNTSLVMLIMIFFIPGIIATTSFLYGYKSGKIDYMYSILTALLFIPAIYIYMNITAWIYVIIYFLVTFVFNVIGKYFRNVKEVNK